jgi:1-acyl-sn-glycerol-3-phosphate acyltransferase
MNGPATAIPGLPRRGNRVTAGLARGALRLAGWRIVGEFPDQPRLVAIVAPHTSNWDFLVGVAVMFALRLRINWLGKHTLFRWPIRGLFRWLGGEPVDRSAPGGTVGAAITRFHERQQLVLGLSPEGTRRPVPQWRTGFYRIAQGAGVPIIPVWFDYSTRTIGIGLPIDTGSDLEAGIARIRALFSKDMARRPAGFADPPEGGSR